jgi:hypothetical protein
MVSFINKGVTEMAKFNKSLKSGVVVIAVSHKYDDNNGAYSVATIWDGNQLSEVNYAIGYNGGSYDDAVVDATPEQIAVAAKHYIDECKSTGTDCQGNTTFVGCVVTLARSRKAPNRVPLKVVEYSEACYDAYYNTHRGAEILVQGLEEYSPVWVSINCVSKVITGQAPWWA